MFNASRLRASFQNAMQRWFDNEKSGPGKFEGINTAPEHNKQGFSCVKRLPF